jgi:hypothetical protein
MPLCIVYNLSVDHILVFPKIQELEGLYCYKIVTLSTSPIAIFVSVFYSGNPPISKFFAKSQVEPIFFFVLQVAPMFRLWTDHYSSKFNSGSIVKLFFIS